MTIRRNDPCPCGSGKKYKHCCGKNNVTSIDHIILDELQQIQMRVMNYTAENYNFQLNQKFNSIYKQLKKLAIPEEIIEVLFLIWYISTNKQLDGKTILHNFVKKESRKISRVRTRSIVESWKTGLPIIAKSNKKFPNQYILEDLLTGKTYQVHAKDEMEDGSIQVVVLLPFTQNEYMLFGPPTNMPASLELPMKRLLELNFQDSDFEIEEDFIQENFLFLINDLFTILEEVFDEFEASDEEYDELLSVDFDEFLENLPLEKSVYKEVAKGINEFLDSLDIDEKSIKTICLFWVSYCNEFSPTIRKPSIYTAALVYMFSFVGFVPADFTYKQLAKEFEVSAGSISRIVDTMYDYFMEKIYEYEEESEDEIGTKQVRVLSEPGPTEQVNWELTLAMSQKEVADESDLSDVINQFNKGKLAFKAQSPREKAQKLLYEAYEKQGEEKLNLAKKALEIYPDSADAYNILAEFAEDDHDAVELLIQGLEAGLKDIKKYDLHDDGDFWLSVETRPYMRVKLNLATMFEVIGQEKAAMGQYEELLELNPNDNQGVRYTLLALYLKFNKLKDAKALMKKYDENSSLFAYAKVLLELTENGLTKKARALWKEAIKMNPYISDFLTGKLSLPTSIPDYYQIGSQEEAVTYIFDILSILEANKKAKENLETLIGTNLIIR